MLAEENLEKTSKENKVYMENYIKAFESWEMFISEHKIKLDA